MVFSFANLSLFYLHIGVLNHHAHRRCVILRKFLTCNGDILQGDIFESVYVHIVALKMETIGGLHKEVHILHTHSIHLARSPLNTLTDFVARLRIPI